MDNPFFSIIIPVYKTEKYLRECLDSILRQTCGEFEAIVVDDGSPDGCPEICDSYAAQDSRITVIHKENEGVVKARNMALELVKGKYLVFVDSDDWIDRDMLEEYRDLIEDNQADMVISGNNYLEFEDKTILQGYPVHSGRYSKDSLKTLQDNMLYSGTFYEYYLNPAMGVFVLKIHHYVRFFVHGFRFLRERVYLRSTKIVRSKCWRGFNMLCSSCFLSWQEAWMALRFSPVG